MWQLIDKPGADPKSFKLTGDQAIGLLDAAAKAAKAADLGWMEQKIVLKPTKELAELVRQSQKAAAKQRAQGEAK